MLILSNTVFDTTLLVNDPVIFTVCKKVWKPCNL